jgi:NAD(P)-dependent dehydrogenase (short-subunit alcohol dehydrogenase family)
MARACEGLTALVTGASRGIGAAIARRLAAEGAAVAVTARTLDEGGHHLEGSLNATVAAIDAGGGRAVAIVADLTDADDRARIVPEVEAALGSVDILVNNAAAAFYLPTAEMSLKRRRLLFELNVHACVDLAQAAVPGMRKRGRGWIVNISSATSRHVKGPPYDRGHKLGTTSTMYGASKAALERFTTGLAAELHADGIAVNSLAPVAAVRTPGAEMLVGDVLDANPGIVEELDYFVDAALVLCTCDPANYTGRVLSSRDVLDR